MERVTATHVAIIPEELMLASSMVGWRLRVYELDDDKH